MKILMKLTFGLAIVASILPGSRLAHASTTHYVFSFRNGLSCQYLDLPSDNTSTAMFVQQFQYNGGRNQQWGVEPVVGSCVLGAPIECDGYVYIYPRSVYDNTHAFGMLLDVVGLSQNSGVQVQTYWANRGSNQQWLLINIGSFVNGIGYPYKLQNRNSGKYLEAGFGWDSSVVYKNDF